MNDVHQVVAAASRKAELAARFATEELMGIEYINEIAMLPNGQEMGRCTNCAWFVVETLGEGEVWGFRVDDNPSVTQEEVVFAFGHDFAVIEGRYIVDPWIDLYTGAVNQGVFDLQDPADAPRIAAIYGDPACWSQLQPYPRPRGPG